MNGEDNFTDTEMLKPEIALAWIMTHSGPGGEGWLVWDHPAGDTLALMRLGFPAKEAMRLLRNREIE
jgi:hypothetical protein